MRRLLNLSPALLTLAFICGFLLAPKAGWAAFSPGTVDIFADATYASPNSATYDAGLASKLQRLQQDLVADGWQVIYHVVARDPGINAAGVPLDKGASVRRLKEQIYADAAQAGNLKAVILFGHVPQPYSGDFGETNHNGAYPCDGYYGDISDPDPNPADPNYPDTKWTDNTVNDTLSMTTANYNIPLDGKFDQSNFPDQVTLEVGRIDFANMTDFTLTEDELLAQYLDKDHSYRMGYTRGLPQARSYASYDTIPFVPGDVNQIYNSWYNPTGLPSSTEQVVTPANMLPPNSVTGAGLTYFPNGDIFYQDLDIELAPFSYQDFTLTPVTENLINGTYTSIDGYNEGFGQQDTPADNATFVDMQASKNGIVETTPKIDAAVLPANDPRSIFDILSGRNSDDLQFPNNVVRAAIGTPRFGLASVWSSGDNTWDELSTMSTGNEIGVGVAAAQYAGNNTYYALVGDPTLRLFYPMPPSGLTATADPTSGVDVTWSVAYGFDATMQLTGYNIYSSSSATGPFTLLASAYNGSINTLTNTMEYTDTTASTTAPTYYMVKAVYNQMPAANVYEDPAAASALTPAYVNVSEGDSVTYTPNVVGPSIQIITPTNLEQANGAFSNLTNGVPLTTSAQSIMISARATPSTGNKISSVQFYRNGFLFATSTSATPPWDAVVTSLSAGMYTFTAVVTDSAGNQATSQAVRVYVYQPFFPGGTGDDNVAPFGNVYYYIYPGAALSSGWWDNTNTPAPYSGPSADYGSAAFGDPGYSSDATSDGVTFNNVSITDLAISGSNSDVVSSVNNPFGPANVGGNLIITAGTGFTQTTLKIESVDRNGNATLSGSAGTPGASGGSATINGGSYILQHAPIDTSQFASSMLWLQIANPLTANSIKITVFAPNSGPNEPQSVKQFTILANASPKGAPFSNITDVAIPLADLPGKLDSSGVIQNNFDGLTIQVTTELGPKDTTTVPPSATFDADEIIISPENPSYSGQQALAQADAKPTASLVDYYTDVPIPAQKVYWAQGSGYELRVDAADSSSAIEEADFFAGTATTPPFVGYGQVIPPPVGQPFSIASYSFDWVPGAVGTNYLSATAIDGLGNSVTTPPVPVVVDNLYGYVTTEDGVPDTNATITLSQGATSVASFKPGAATVGADASTSIGYSDLTISASNTSVVSSAVLPFKTADQGAVLDITGGTGFNPGPYTIVTVNPDGTALLSAPAGTAGSTGGIASRISSGVIYSDLAIGATATQVSSASTPFHFSDIGSTLLVTGGTGFTAATYTITAVNSAGVATLNVAAGSANSTGGQAILVRSGTANYTAGIAPGTYTITASDAPTYAPISRNITLSTTASLREDFVLTPGITDLKAVGGNDQVVLSWTASSAATSYNVYVGTTSGGETFDASTANNTFTVTGLNPNTTYYFEVTVVDASGVESGFSNEATAVTFPAAPTTLQATAGTKQVALTWTSVDPNVSYNVYEGTSSGGESTTPIGTVAQGAPTTYTATGLSDGVTYYFTVAAVNASSEVGPVSNEASGTTTPPAPTLTATGGNLQAVLTWPATLGATSYNVYESSTHNGENYNTPIATDVTADTYTMTGLAFGSTYYFTIKAVNGAGTSPASNEASTTATAAPPTNLSAVGGFEQATLTWTASSGASSYNVYAGTTSGGESSTPVATGVTSTSVTVKGLNDGTRYFFTVSSVNAGGPSGPSNEFSILTSPAIPVGVTATPAIDQVTLSWTASATATSYNVYEGTSSNGESATPIVSNSTGTSITLTNLSPASRLYFQVTAANATGSSPASAEVSTTPLAPIPAAPINVQALAGNGQAVITWTAATGATSYNVFVSNTSGGEAAPAAATSITTSATISGLTNGTRYYFTVQAIDSGGTSPMSAEASAVPVAPVTYSAGWHLFSVPLDYSSVSIDTALGTTGDPKPAVLFTWQPVEYQYAVSPNAPADHLRLGVGYWCNFAHAITTGVGGVPADPTKDFEIDLQQGWNMIGDPFETTIPLSSLKFGSSNETFAQATAGSHPLIAGTVWDWNAAANNNYGAYAQATSLSEGNGYWMYAYSATTLIVPHP